MVIVDTVITYSWMGLLVALAPWQDAWDRWVKADRSKIDDVIKRLNVPPPQSSPTRGEEASGWHALWLIRLGMLVGALCLRAGTYLPVTTSLNASGWAFLLVTAAGIGLSLTPAARLERYGSRISLPMRLNRPRLKVMKSGFIWILLKAPYM